MTEGLRDLPARRETVASLLVEIGAPRLGTLRIAVPVTADSPEHRRYALLAQDGPDSAHSRYNALVARLVALVTAACEGGMTPVAPSASTAATNIGVASQPAPATSMSFAAKASKVDVCHVEGNGSFHLINVSDNARR